MNYRVIKKSDKIMTNNGKKMRILNIETDIWWWKYLPERKPEMQLRIARINKSGFLKQIISLIKIYLKLDRFDVVITQQDSYETFVIAGLNRIFGQKRCRHFVNEFITRERKPGLYSNVKYLILKFCLSSVYCLICSSNLEISYYREQLQLRKTRFAFVPLATDPAFFKMKTGPIDEYIVSAGRTGRDYSTLVQAAKDIAFSFKIIADYKNISGIPLPQNIEIIHNIPLKELLQIIAKAKIVVLPLQNKPISVGQSVLLQAMALGKAVIATRNAGTVDYIEHDKNGLLVESCDSNKLKESILYLLNNPKKVKMLGEDAKKTAFERYTIQTRIKTVCSLINEKH
jgi:glycosyltransferase involved in cell wall biosynthesis